MQSTFIKKGGKSLRKSFLHIIGIMEFCNNIHFVTFGKCVDEIISIGTSLQVLLYCFVTLISNLSTVVFVYKENY